MSVFSGKDFDAIKMGGPLIASLFEVCS